MRIVGILLVLAGIVALATGGFSYTQDKTVAKLGPLELNSRQTHTVDIPLWGGVGAIVAGVVLVALGGGRGRR
jgi:UDP-N-acetylmuramyl pentapeptide phosphotransferase/UDP-N-acetylglucosamine-1-phosphate transferase